MKSIVLNVDRPRSVSPRTLSRALMMLLTRAKNSQISFLSKPWMFTSALSATMTSEIRSRLRFRAYSQLALSASSRAHAGASPSVLHAAYASVLSVRTGSASRRGGTHAGL